MPRKGKVRITNEDTSTLSLASSLSTEIDDDLEHEHSNITATDLDAKIVSECYNTLKKYTYDNTLLLFNSFNSKQNFIDFISLKLSNLNNENELN